VLRARAGFVEYLGWFRSAGLHRALGDRLPAEFEALSPPRTEAVTATMTNKKPDYARRRLTPKFGQMRALGSLGEARGNIGGNIQIVRCVHIVREPGRFGRSGALRTDMTPELPG
jgi:hypothetical protein